MTKCYQTSIEFPRVKRRKVEANFDGGEITSDAGAVLLRQSDLRVGLTKSIAKKLDDSRRQASCDFDLRELIAQRIYALALGYEDLNDHQLLRNDIALQTSVQRDQTLASAPTLCRLENRADRATAIALHEVLFEQFVKAHDKPPKRLILDFDATDTPIHGDQDQRFFHGYYDHYCYLPLYVFCGRHLLVSYLRPSNIDPAKHSWAILSLLVKSLREQWPSVEIVFRGDSGFCRWRMLSWCERHDVRYIVGIAKNDRLLKAAHHWTELSHYLFERLGKKQRLFGSIRYAAHSWDHSRRVIVKAEHSSHGPNPRFIVTNLEQSDQYLYDKIYCARGEMENRIKDQQLSLFADRTSCSKWWPNQFRQLLSGMAYVLFEAMRRLSLKNTSLKVATPATIRLQLLKVGAVVIRNTRRVKIMMSSSYPFQRLFALAASALNSS